MDFGYHRVFHKFLFHTMEFQLSWSLSRIFLSHDGISAITEPFMNFSFTRWNFSYHGAFHELFFYTMEFRLSWSLSRTFLSHNGISAITEPFMNFSLTRWNFGYHRAFHELFFHRWNFGYHRAFHELFFHTMEFRLSQSVRGWDLADPQGGYPSGCRLIDGGSGPKSVGGSS
jgi:hypothetical protein